MTSGAALFARYAFPPNIHGFCGPTDSGLVDGLLTADVEDEIAHVVQQFEGAWPYLELIAACNRLDPLDRRVVEAYWIGNDLLDHIDLLMWGNSVGDRFHRRAGSNRSALDSAIPDGLPNHAFHVFCAYPWVGLLRSGFADHALEVIDRCRIRWGSVIDVFDTTATVTSQPLEWDGLSLSLGSPIWETVRVPIDGSRPKAGDNVSMHWDYICVVLGACQVERLKLQTARHLVVVNREGQQLSSVIES